MPRTRRRRVRVAPRLEALEVRSLLSASPATLPAVAPADPARTLLVRFQDDRLPTSMELVRLGSTVVDVLPSGTVLLDTGRASARDLTLARLWARPDVLSAEPDQIIDISWIPNDPRFSQQWGLNNGNNVDIDAPQAWDLFRGSSTTVVAVTDTGIDLTHPDLYLAIAVKQSAIPATIYGLPRSGIVDTDGNGVIDFYDLNSLAADGQTVLLGSNGLPINASYVRDNNGNGRIDASDLLDPNNGWGLGSGVDLVGWNFVANTNNPSDDNGHGTHVSGTIAARTNNGIGVAGVDPSARILPLKFLGSNGSGSLSAAVAAIDYAANYGSRVINASWAGGSFSSSLRNSINNAGQAGSVFVAAAGNDGRNNDTSPSYPASYNLPNLLSVASVTSSGALSGFSNFGATSVHVGAPGSGIMSTTLGGGYGNSSGTSMAAPHVAGVVSLVAGLAPSLSAVELVDLIKASTKPLTSLAGRTVTGGIVSAVLALEQLGPSAPFLGQDLDTQGWWRTNYGADGHLVVAGTTALPAGVKVTPSGHQTYTWASTSSDPRALLKSAGGTERVMSTWYAPGSFSVMIEPPDNQARRVTIYAADYDRKKRSQRIDVIDPGSGRVLDSRTLESFAEGVYLSWEIRGPIELRFTRLAGANALLSGLFFGEGVPVETGASATFLTTDTATRGTWWPSLGTLGYQIVAGTTALPTGLSLTPAGHQTYTWASTSSDPRALLKSAGGTERVMSTWYAPGSFSVMIEPPDNQVRRVTIYAADYDRRNRRQLIEVVDAASGEVLDSRTLESFGDGVHLSWALRGKVLLRFTRLAGSNSLLSGIFFDPV